MILPSKHLRLERSLLGIGADVLDLLHEPKTVSRLWDELKNRRGENARQQVTFDRYTLAIAMLFSIDAIKTNRGRVAKRVIQ